jgi:DNA-binding MarR family transcriptional regulator
MEIQTHIIDTYVIDTLMRDLVGHDRKPTSFLVYLWLSAEQSATRSQVVKSYQEIAESIGISKSSAQSAIRWLLRRKLIAVTRESITATPGYRVLTPWKRPAPQRTE